MSVLFCLRGLEIAVPSVSNIITAYGGHHHFMWVAIKHREHMDTSYVNLTEILYLFYILINIVNHILEI